MICSFDVHKGKNLSDEELYIKVSDITENDLGYVRRNCFEDKIIVMDTEICVDKESKC